MSDIGAEIEKLRTMTGPELIAKYEHLFAKPPRVKHRAHLWKRCAWKLQEQRYGGLSGAAKARLDALIAEIDIGIDGKERGVKTPLRGHRKKGKLAVGTTLVRRWRDRDIRVVVTESGYELDGQTYRSLTAAVQAITGAHWNPKIFFGLVKRKRSR